MKILDLDWVILLSNNITKYSNRMANSQNDFDRFLLDKYDNYDKIYNGIHHHETIEVKDSNDTVIVKKD